jgi:uncharacterized membrane protein
MRALRRHAGDAADEVTMTDSAGADAHRPNRPTPFPKIRRVAISAPLRWIGAGWRDFRRAPAASGFYGAAFALMGWLIYLVFSHAYEYTSALTAGFLLVGPFVATGLYDISRRLERGETVALRSTLTAWRTNVGAFSLFALVLTVILLVWARASLVTFALFFSTGMPTLSGFLQRVVSLEHLDFLLTYLAVGLVFAAIVFSVSVVSVPMMLDRGTDTIVAALTSVRALAENPVVLTVWALLIVLLIGIGFATLFAGLVVTAPIVGHATWHAYRDLVGPAAPAA